MVQDLETRFAEGEAAREADPTTRFYVPVYLKFVRDLRDKWVDDPSRAASAMRDPSHTAADVDPEPTALSFGPLLDLHPNLLACGDMWNRVMGKEVGTK